MASGFPPDSPDPLTLPSSPLTRPPNRPNRSPTRSPHLTRQSLKPPQTNLASRSPGSPAKSFFVDPGVDGNASPWRIKVTVETEETPRKGKMVPLKGGSSSPSKAAESGKGKGQGKRKRKGTPVPKKAIRDVPEEKEEEEDAQGKVAQGYAGEEEDALMELPPSDVDGVQARLSTDAERRSTSATKRRRQSFQKMPSTGRYKRLSQAREELDVALHDAVGYSDEGDDEGEDRTRRTPRSSAAPGGDMTVTENEDFTMISMETLKSIREGNTSLMDDSRVDDSRMESATINPAQLLKSSTKLAAERKKNANGAGAETSFWPSSPPQAPPQFGEQTQQILAYPSVSAQAAGAQATSYEPPVYDQMSWEPTGNPVEAPADYDMMSWQPTGRPKEAPPMPQIQDEDVVSAQQNPPPGAEAQTGAADDRGSSPAQHRDPPSDDIWAEEASRLLHEDSILQATASSASKAQHEAQGPLQAENIEEIFSAPLKPPRAKIPRTWRRSSGMDFAYSDSPAHGNETAPEATSARNESEKAAESDGPATEDGRGSGRSDGVLTPPSSGEDDAQQDVELEGGDPSAESSFMQPDAAGTQLQNGHSDDEADGADGVVGNSTNAYMSADDTGIYWQQAGNLHSQLPKPRPYVEPQKRAADLSELFARKYEDSATANANASFFRGGELSSDPFTGANASTEPNLFQPATSSTRARAWNKPQQLKQSHETTAALSSSLTSNGANDVDTSFASKASDQRQLLGEVSVSPKKRAKLSMEAYIDTDAYKESEAEFTEGGSGSEWDWDEDGEDEGDEWRGWGEVSLGTVGTGATGEITGVETTLTTETTGTTGIIEKEGEAADEDVKMGGEEEEMEEGTWGESMEMTESTPINVSLESARAARRSIEDEDMVTSEDNAEFTDGEGTIYASSLVSAEVYESSDGFPEGEEWMEEDVDGGQTLTAEHSLVSQNEAQQSYADPSYEGEEEEDEDEEVEPVLPSYTQRGSFIFYTLAAVDSDNEAAFTDGGSGSEYDSSVASEEEYDSDDDSDDGAGEQSYQEFLNVASPKKVQVNFGSSMDESSLAVTKPQVPPAKERYKYRCVDRTGNVLSNSAKYILESSSEYTLESLATLSPEPTPAAAITTDAATTLAHSLFTRVATAFWAHLPKFLPTTASTPPPYDPVARARLRLKFGVHPSTHPLHQSTWRALTRVFESVDPFPRRASSNLIPATLAPLPTALREKIGTQQRVIGARVIRQPGLTYTFTERDARVVEAFMQLLVPPAHIAAIEAGHIAPVGDALSRAFATEFEPKKHMVFEFPRPPVGSAVTREHVVEVLGRARWEVEKETRGEGKEGWMKYVVCRDGFVRFVPKRWARGGVEWWGGRRGEPGVE